ncbi:hypothetical protein F2Q68_00041526 [Brassica cretica]|uniref:Uncharacterized protein n=1 Tax=Brassica cretica TaxID=69181 RepID=A0A8S9M9W4_BRACR|nr:hypothetical protein F2Q68_00041526 [Brassica cretica]
MASSLCWRYVYTFALAMNNTSTFTPVGYIMLFSAGICSEKSIICSAGALSSESAGFPDAGERGLMICDSVIAVFCMVDQFF